ncbi:MAG: ribosome small subunit-dependent GTPase A [Gemmataceae bacterium]
MNLLAYPRVWPAMNADELPAARVAVEHRSGYVLLTDDGRELSAELAGRLRHDAERGLPPGLPAVGDRVRYRPTDDGRAVVHTVEPRRSLFVRKEAGRRHAAQPLASNVDAVFLVSPLPDGVNLRRLERFLSLTYDSGAKPVFVLNKADLCPDPLAALAILLPLAADVPLHVVSAANGTGIAELETYFVDGATVALLGASGVGKSSLINRLLGREVLATGGLREDGKGRHTTTHRQLLVRPGGGAVIDTPGLRELALWEGGDGVESAFAEVEDFAAHCRFRDCTHESEPGCAVRAAVASGQIDADRLTSYRALRAELAYLERRGDVQAQQERKRRDKALIKEANRYIRRKRH